MLCIVFPHLSIDRGFELTMQLSVTFNSYVHYLGARPLSNGHCCAQLVLLELCEVEHMEKQVLATKSRNMGRRGL